MNDTIQDAIGDLRDLVRCRCHSDYKDRGMHDPYCDCDSAEAVEVLARAIPTTQPDREHVAFSMWKAEADRAAPNVGKKRTPEGFAVAADQERTRWLKLADAAIRALIDNYKGTTP
jgi:hypothetical protein